MCKHANNSHMHVNNFSRAQKGCFDACCLGALYVVTWRKSIKTNPGKVKAFTDDCILKQKMCCDPGEKEREAAQQPKTSVKHIFK